MSYHIMSIPCLRIIQDKYSKLSSVMDIIDAAKVDSSEKVLSFPPFKLFSRWGKTAKENESESFELKITMSNNNKKEMKEVLIDKFSVDIPEKASFATVIMEFERIVVQEEGLWFMHIFFREKPKDRWKEASKLPLTLRRKDQSKTKD